MFEVSKYLGILAAKINGYHFDQILIPLLHKREAQSTMYIEGTQTTISDVFEDELRTQPNNATASAAALFISRRFSNSEKWGYYLHTFIIVKEYPI